MPEFNNEEKQEKKIEEFLIKEEEDLAQILSTKHGVQYIDLSGTAINTDALVLLPEKEARANKLAVFDIVRKKIKIAVISPANNDTKKLIEELEKKGYQPTIFMVSSQSLERAWERYKDVSFSVRTEEGLLSISEETIEKFKDKTQGLEGVRESLKFVLEKEKISKVSKFFDVLLAGALSLGASDIHIEGEEEFARLRFRLDGMLTEIIQFDPKTYHLLTSRIKLISGLKLNINNNAQDGRLSIKVGDVEIEIRTSTMPGTYGESSVMRILDPDAISVSIQDLGIEPDLLKTLEREMSKPNGMILNTGPTGSGKTTTLYAFLSKIHNPEIKIVTIQDPDVVMVGEIRDTETAEIAINSALTGHLVLSTLHTNTAAGTFPRFVDLGIDPKVLGSAINVTMAQRLVRKLCKECKKEVEIIGEDKIIIDKIYEGILNKEKFEVPNKTKMFAPVGCVKCNESGYKGRLGVFEAIVVDEEIENIIRENPSEREIKRAAQKQGILDMQQDGVLKVLRGTTSLDELRRVIELE